MYFNGHISFLHNPWIFWNKINDLRKHFYVPNILRAINFLPGNNPTISLGLSAVILQPLFLLPWLSISIHAALRQEAIKQITIFTTHSSQCELLFITFKINFCALSHDHKAIETADSDRWLSTIALNYHKLSIAVIH